MAAWAPAITPTFHATAAKKTGRSPTSQDMSQKPHLLVLPTSHCPGYPTSFAYLSLTKLKSHSCSKQQGRLGTVVFTPGSIVSSKTRNIYYQRREEKERKRKERKASGSLCLLRVGTMIPLHLCAPQGCQVLLSPAASSNVRSTGEECMAHWMSSMPQERS